LHQKLRTSAAEEFPSHLTADVLYGQPLTCFVINFSDDKQTNGQTVCGRPDGRPLGK